MLRLIDLIPELDSQARKYKVHFATGTKYNNPLNAFFNNKFQDWQEWQSKRNFEREFILSFIYYEPNLWLFAGIFKSVSSDWVDDHYIYTTEQMDMAEEFIGRLVVRFEKDFRASYLKLENHYERFLVSEILRERIAVMQFLGYENVNIKFEDLKSVFYSNEVTWKTALENAKGIYLITDIKNGKHYVGSAYGEEALWTRWMQYANTGHGGNAELRQLLKVKGDDYVKYFRFSILEIRDKTTNTDEIIRRENHWKEILLTREFGYNQN